jgi:hypothetical protein
MAHPSLRYANGLPGRSWLDQRAILWWLTRRYFGATQQARTLRADLDPTSHNAVVALVERAGAHASFPWCISLARRCRESLRTHVDPSAATHQTDELSAQLHHAGQGFRQASALNPREGRNTCGGTAHVKQGG